MHKILVVDDDPFFLELVNRALGAYEIITATDCDAALQAYSEHQPALISLDINLQDSDGYGICQQIREQDEHTPILFMSSQNDLDSRLRAYGQGGNDFIGKPFQRDELAYKAEKLINQHLRQQSLADQLSNSSSLLTTMQRESAHLQTVNRFIQSSMHCKDLDSLIKIFFVALRELGTSGVLLLHSEPDSPRECGGTVTRLEREILYMGHKLPRIHSFGHNRALFNWHSSTLLVRELNGLIDILAILMDSLEVVQTAIATEASLVSEIEQLESANLECKNHVEALINDMSLSLQDNLITLGMVSDLGESEERMINDTINDYCQQIQSELDNQAQRGLRVRQLIEQLRTPSQEMRNKLQQVEQDTDLMDSVELF